MNWYLEALRNYANFEGRARRKEYWMFSLFNLIFCFVAILFDIFIIGVAEDGVGIVYLIYLVAMIIPSLSVSVRRMHDIGKSGFMILVGLVPLVGGIWFLILAITEGDRGENQYGSDPKDTIY